MPFSVHYETDSDFLKGGRGFVIICDPVFSTLKALVLRGISDAFVLLPLSKLIQPGKRCQDISVVRSFGIDVVVIGLNPPSA